MSEGMEELEDSLSDLMIVACKVSIKAYHEIERRMDEDISKFSLQDLMAVLSNVATKTS